MTNKYLLQATGVALPKIPDLVDFVRGRKEKKDEIWRMRNDKLIEMSGKMDRLISIYAEHRGAIPTTKKQAFLFYKSALAHQVFNTLMGTKLSPDFIDFTPLGGEGDLDLLQKTKNLTQAHRIWRYKGGFEKAKQEAKQDFVWGNSFIEMSTSYEGDDAMFTEYTHAPWKEVRNFYGDQDILRVIDYSIDSYASIYGKDMLNNVSLGGITDVAEIDQKEYEEDAYERSKDIIQVIRYYHPTRKIFGEIHGGNGFIYKNLEGDDYQFTWKNGQGFVPFKESRFFEQISSDYFGWGVLDYIINLANLETTITNLTAMEAVWDAGAPSFIFTGDPNDMEQKIAKHLRNLNKGINVPIVQKDTGVGTKGQIQQLKKGVDNQNMKVWDEVTNERAMRFSNVDVLSITQESNTAEQQKLRKIESDKLNLRVLLTNEQREKDFAIKEMSFIQEGKTAFHDYEINVMDELSEQFQTESGYMPPKAVRIGDILDGINDVELKIAPRMEGVLDDMDFMELKAMQDSILSLAPGTAAYDIAQEKRFAKQNPDWGLKRTHFSTPTAPVPLETPGGGGDRAPKATEGLGKQLALSV